MTRASWWHLLLSHPGKRTLVQVITGCSGRLWPLRSALRAPFYPGWLARPGPEPRCRCQSVPGVWSADIGCHQPRILTTCERWLWGQTVSGLQYSHCGAFTTSKKTLHLIVDTQLSRWYQLHKTLIIKNSLHSKVWFSDGFVGFNFQLWHNVNINSSKKEFSEDSSPDCPVTQNTRRCRSQGRWRHQDDSRGRGGAQWG